MWLYSLPEDYQYLSIFHIGDQHEKYCSLKNVLLTLFKLDLNIFIICNTIKILIKGKQKYA